MRNSKNILFVVLILATISLASCVLLFPEPEPEPEPDPPPTTSEAPAAPTGITVTTGNRTVTLTWPAVTAAESYHVHRNGEQIATTTAPSYTDTGLTNGTRYSYTVQALNAEQRASIHSNEITAIPTTPDIPLPALPAPENLLYTTGDRTVTLTWTAVAGAESYRIYRDGTHIATTLTIRVYIDAELENDTPYRYTVQALDVDLRESNDGISVTAIPSAPPAPVDPPAPTDPPEAPENLRYTTGDRTVTLIWKAVTTAESYHVHRNGEHIATTTAPSHTDNDLTNGTPYRYTVRALDADLRASSPGNEVIATPSIPEMPLAAPGNFRFDAGNGVITLSWNAVVGADSYHVYRNEERIETPSPIIDPAYIDNEVVNDTTYRYTVRAVDSPDRVSIDSIIISATPFDPAARPAAPRDLIFSTGNGTMVLSWKRVAVAASYHVYRDGDRIAADVTITDLTYTDRDVTLGTTYVYTVRTVDNRGRVSVDSFLVSGFPYDPAAVPGIPQNLRFTAGNSEVRLSWDAVTSAVAYRVFRNGRRIGTDTVINDPNYKDETVANDNTYIYTVQAEADNSFTSSPSASVRVIPFDPADIPDAPEDLRFTIRNRAVMLSWDSVAGAASYHVYRDGERIGADTAINARSFTSTYTYTDNNVANGTEYRYTVRAVDYRGRISNDSVPVNATPTAPPTVPTEFRVVAGNSAVMLSWADVTSAASYRIYRNRALLETNPPTITGFTYTDNNVVNGTEYSYTVRAVDRYGRISGNSTRRSTIPFDPDDIPDTPEGLALVAGEGEVRLSWRAVGTATSYRIYRNGNAEPLVTDPPTITRTAYTDNNVNNNTEYSYTVRAVDRHARVSNASAPMSATPMILPRGDLLTLSDDFSDSDNTSPQGLWSNGTTMWVTDDADIIYAYNVDSKERDPDEDFNTLGDAGNIDPRGIWSNGMTMWVADFRGSKIYAYNLTSKEREPGKDFDTLEVAGNEFPRGIWSNGITMWVVDWVDDKIYAYDLTSKERDPGKDFDTLIAARNEQPSGIWGNADTIWVSDIADDRLYAYTIASKERDSDKDFTDLDDAVGNSTATKIFGIWGNADTMWMVNNIGFYSARKIFAYNMDNKERNEDKEFSTLGVVLNKDPQGIWSDGTTMWVADFVLGKLFAYDLTTKDYDRAKDFDTLIDAGNEAPRGIWSNGTTMWVSDWDDKKIYAYNLTSKEREPGNDFDTLIAARNELPAGISGNADTMWVVDTGDKKIYAYNMGNKEHNPAQDFNTLSIPFDAFSTNHRPGGLWSNNTTMWVSDSDQFYAYHLGSKERDPANDFNPLAERNGFSFGLWSNGITMWASDTSDDADRIFAYDMATRMPAP